MVKFTKIHGILSNFERKNRKKNKKLFEAEAWLRQLVKKSVYELRDWKLVADLSKNGEVPIMSKEYFLKLKLRPRKI